MQLVTINVADRLPIAVKGWLNSKSEATSVGCDATIQTIWGNKMVNWTHHSARECLAVYSKIEQIHR